MKSAKRNLIIALGLATSLVLPGLAMADSWKQQSQRHSPQQRQENRHDGHDHDRYRESARRDNYGRHEWREHHRQHRFDSDRYYGYNEGRGHARPYHVPPRYYGYGYGVYPGAYLSGVYAAPSVGLVIDLR
jgi:hypothetical protein